MKIFLANCNLSPQAQQSYESAIKQAKDLHDTAAAPPSVISEYEVWEANWCRCAQELGQWETLSDFGRSQNGANPFLGEGEGSGE